MLLGKTPKDQNTVEMVRLQVPQSNQQDNNKQITNTNDTTQSEIQRPCLWYIISWVLFIVACGIYVGIWAITKYAANVQASYYYHVDHYISPYISNNTNNGCSSTLNGTIMSSSIHTSGELTDAKAVALSLIYSWLMWKLPMALFMLHLIYQAQNRILKYVSWGIALVLMLAADIVLTIFLKDIYTQYMFYGFAMLLTIIVSLVNNRGQLKSAFLSSFFPLIYIALLYFTYSYFIPLLFNLIFNNVIVGYSYIMIYGYPILDFIFYALLLVMNARESLKLAKPLLAFIQFFLLGYLAGITLLASVTEVQFYYLVGYMLFRNFFTNWVMYRWDSIVNNPPCLPGWGLLYYVSYALNFLPVIGLGKLVISKSFLSQQFSQSCLLLSYFPSGGNIYDTTTPDISSLNISFKGYIFWGAALVIWVISTATQKYPRRKPNFFDLFYNLAGIYMFYLGISAGLQLLTLRQITIL